MRHVAKAKKEAFCGSTLAPCDESVLKAEVNDVAFRTVSVTTLHSPRPQLAGVLGVKHPGPRWGAYSILRTLELDLRGSLCGEGERKKKGKTREGDLLSKV